MMIYFMGIHNKPGKAPLDSRTKTGRVVDTIITRIQALHTREKLIFEKTNLYDVDYLPLPASIDAERWAQRTGFNASRDHLIILGHEASQRTKAFLAGADVLRLGHPGTLRTATEEDEYIVNAVEAIRKFLIP